MKAEQSLLNSDLTKCLQELQAQVRDNPSDAKYRVFLFQLLCVLGEWDRALTQLNVAADLDHSTLAMAQAYRETLQCEKLREEVFAGRKTPLIFGEPEQWMALCLEALGLYGKGMIEQAKALREQAYELLEARSGVINDEDFTWICDADSRIGPFLEAVINGNYYWVPFAQIQQLKLDPPEDLRDFVWTPAQFTWVNGGQAVAFIPTRYNPLNSQDSQLLLAKKTLWQEHGANEYFGQGQRLLTTDNNDYALLDVRELTFN